MISGSNPDHGQAVAGGLGLPDLFGPADLGNPDDRARVVAETDARFGRVDVLVHAGALATLTAITAFTVPGNRFRICQPNPGWRSTNNVRDLQRAESGDLDREAKASAALTFGRLIDLDEVAKAVNDLVSNDAGLMTRGHRKL